MLFCFYRILLAFYTPSVLVLLGCALGWSLGYLCWMELNHYNNGGVWPYPILDEVFTSCLPNIAFVVLMMGITLAITMGLWALAATNLHLPH